LEDQVAALRQSLEESQKMVEENRDNAQRAQAELINYRRRADEDRISLQQYSNSRLIIKFLPVIDELDLAIGHAEENSSSDSWWEGVKLIQRKMAGLLESEGVVKIEAVGEIFDPLQHEALGTTASSEYPPGYIVEVVRNGYRLHDRVIQPAQVVVARESRETDSISN
jgi:molecular chaperone GrpE